MTLNRLFWAILLLVLPGICRSGERITLPDSGVFSRIVGKWRIDISTESGKADLWYQGKLILAQNQASFKVKQQLFRLEGMKGHEVTATAWSDSIGVGTMLEVRAKTEDNLVMLRQYYILYSDKDFIQTWFSLESKQTISSGYMAPVLSIVPVNILPGGRNKSLWVPFDNDKWVRYKALGFGMPLDGYEVGAFINEESRNGLVVGSIEHDVWKTGVRASTKAPGVLEKLEVFGGTTSYETRDVLPHGKLTGKLIKSPTIFLGFFDDWRRGMECYADIVELFAPKLPWPGGKPFCWNSWGAIQTNLSYKNATEVALYFADKLQPNGFFNDSTVYIGLDSYWDNIAYSDLFRFVRECKTRRQNAGIYWTPFVDWAKNPNRVVEGTTNTYYKDIYLYANGKPQEIAGAYAVDPTHPATKSRINLYLNRFLTQGFTYIKLDFMTHGALESDAHYDSTVHTGIQAYNQGLQYIVDYLDGRMFVNFSISPLFPSQYGHGRRIACDAYASIGDTEYTLNSLTYGWWLDRVYTCNDADNIVLNGVSTGENRARVTSSVITGLVCAGDNFSESGYSSAKLRAETFLTNPEVNRVARLTKAFYPVEAASDNAAADMFMQQYADTLYLAVFNYTTVSGNKTIDFNRLGLSVGANYIFHELWSGSKEEHSSSWSVSTPRRDVKFFKIYEGSLTAAQTPKMIEFSVYPNPFENELVINADFTDDREISVYDARGSLVKVAYADASKIRLKELKSGLYIMTVRCDDGKMHYSKVIKK